MNPKRYSPLFTILALAFLALFASPAHASDAPPPPGTPTEAPVNPAPAPVETPAPVAVREEDLPPKDPNSQPDTDKLAVAAATLPELPEETVSAAATSDPATLHPELQVIADIVSRLLRPQLDRIEQRVEALAQRLGCG